MSHFLLTIVGSAESLEIAAAELWSLGVSGIEETDAGLRAAFADPDAALRARDLFAPGTAIETVDDDFGFDAHREHLGAVDAGRFVVHPPWITPTSANATPLVVDPGHAFGSGSHPSTRLALDLLGDLELDGGSVVDLGSGTGVLSIAAASLGASVLALDTDPAAVEATLANAERNGVSTAIDGRLGSVENVFDNGRPDVLLVNVTIDLHEAMGPRLSAPVATIVAAGILLDPQVERCAAAWQGRVSRLASDEEWAGVVLVP